MRQAERTAQMAAQRQESGCLARGEHECALVDGVDSLLPVTQKVVSMTEGHQAPVPVGSWDRVREVVGDLMGPTDHYPSRLQVRRYPDAAPAAIDTEEL